MTKAVEKLKTANAGTNKSDIQSSMDSLNAEWNKLASKMYESSKDEGQSGEAPPSPNNKEKKKKDEGEIEDADFEVVD